MRRLVCVRWLWLVFAFWTYGANAQGVDDLDGGAVDDDAGDAHDGESAPASELRGLLASPRFDRQPMKAVYFFPGEASASNRDLYTAHPTLDADMHWNSMPSLRAEVMDRIAAAHVNTVVMSYWGEEMPQWSPMGLDETSVAGVLEAVDNKSLVVVPSLESGFDSDNPLGPHWRFCEDFPYAAARYVPEALAPSFLKRLRALTALFQTRRGGWAQMYDREGRPRYVVHVLQVYALQVPKVQGKTADQVVAQAFDAVAERIHDSEGIDIGFTLDLSSGDSESYGFTPSSSGAVLERAKSVLAVQLFVSEARSGKVINSGPWDPPFDNNAENLVALLDGKKMLLNRWRISGLPVLYDISPGFDGRFVWASIGNGFWGDNYAYTSDDWRNLQSEARDSEYIGITLNTWNGFTEGYAATPTVEHGTTIYDWLSDVYKDDPRDCHHVEYVDGRAAYHLQGPICEKWRSLHGRLGVLGEPTSDIIDGEWASVAHFAEGSVFASSDKGVHEVHGPIHSEYERIGYEASCLGLPIADQEITDTGARSRFEHGVITLPTSATTAAASCTD